MILAYPGDDSCRGFLYDVCGIEFTTYTRLHNGCIYTLVKENVERQKREKSKISRKLRLLIRVAQFAVNLEKVFREFFLRQYHTVYSESFTNRCKVRRGIQSSSQRPPKLFMTEQQELFDVGAG